MSKYKTPHLARPSVSADSRQHITSNSTCVETIESGFCRGMRLKIYQGETGGYFVILDCNHYQRTTNEYVPIRYWNYDSVLLLQRLLDRGMDRLAWWYLQEEKEKANGTLPTGDTEELQR